MDPNKDYLYINEVKRSAVSQALYSFFHRKILTLFLTLVLAVLCIGSTAGVFLLVDTQPKATPSEVWTVSAEEMADWVDGNKEGVTDWQVRFSNWWAFRSPRNIRM